MLTKLSNLVHGGLLIISLVLCVFMGTYRADLSLPDDEFQIVENPNLSLGFGEAMTNIWTSPYHQMYSPIIYTYWYSLNKIGQFFGIGHQQRDPRLFHLTNVGIHAFNGILVMILLYMLTSQIGASVCGALIFALHPIQVEPVAWASAAKDVVFVSLGLLTILVSLFFLRLENASKQKKFMTGSLAVLLFAFAALAKPTAVVIPLLIILFYGPFAQQTKAAPRWILPALMLFAALPVIFVTYLLQNVEATPDFAVPYLDRPQIMLDSLLFYLEKVFYPVGLTFDYSRYPEKVLAYGLDISFFQVVILGVGLLLACKYPLVRLGIGVMIVALLPTSGIINFSFQNLSTVADRYFYLPMLGVAVIAAFLCTGTLAKFRISVAIAVVCLLTVVSFRQVPHWRNHQSLLSHTLEANPESVWAYMNLAAQKGMAGHFDEANALAAKALELRSVRR